MLNILIIMTIEQLTIIFHEKQVFRIPFENYENSDNLERSLVQEGRLLLASPLLYETLREGRRQEGWAVKRKPIHKCEGVKA